MRDCPKCTAYVDGLACRNCGYSEAGASVTDPDRHRCAHLVDGVRCSNHGSVSVGGAPFVCIEHAPDRRTLQRMAIPASYFAAKAAIGLKRLDVEGELERAAIQGEDARG